MVTHVEHAIKKGAFLDVDLKQQAFILYNTAELKEFINERQPEQVRPTSHSGDQQEPDPNGRGNQNSSD